MKKNILITGVSSGIGYDAVRYFVKRGYRVFGSVRKDVDIDRLENIFFDNFVAIKFDVFDTQQIEAARIKVEKILQGRSLDALINNAGYAQAGPMALLSDESFRQQMEVNLFGVRNVTNAFLPLLGAQTDFTGQPGKIINISSISGIFNTPMNGAYCVAKHALESMAEVYRRELMIYGIQVVSIQPGPIESKLWDKNLNALDLYLESDYGKMANKTNNIIKTAQTDALPAKAISQLIEKIVNRKRPKLSYIVTKRKMINTLVVKYLPKRIVDYFMFKSLNR